MRIQRTHENELCSKKVFKNLIVQAMREINREETKKYRLGDDATRNLRLTMIVTVDGKEHLEEAIAVMLSAIVAKKEPEHGVTVTRKADVEDWLVADDETEWVGDAKLEERPLYGVRRVLDRKRVAGVTYYLVDWTPTWETRADVGNSLIVKFEKARRALVRKTFIEDEATIIA